MVENGRHNGWSDVPRDPLDGAPLHPEQADGESSGILRRLAEERARREAQQQRRAEREAKRSKRKVDKWAHRRGEPRALTLLWSIFLMLGAGVTIFTVRLLGMRDATAYDSSGRALLALAAFGVVILWPMVRLSQVSPRRPSRAMAADVFAINLPLQAVIWPLGLLTSWPWTTVGATLATLGAWSVLISALLAIAIRRAPDAGRTGWMALFVAIAVGGPAALAHLLRLGVEVDAMWWMASPIAAMYSLTASPRGLAATTDAAEWIAALAPCAIGLALWAAIAATSPRRGALAPAES